MVYARVHPNKVEALKLLISDEWQTTAALCKKAGVGCSGYAELPQIAERLQWETSLIKIDGNLRFVFRRKQQ